MDKGFLPLFEPDFWWEVVLELEAYKLSHKRKKWYSD